MFGGDNFQHHIFRRRTYNFHQRFLTNVQRYTTVRILLDLLFELFIRLNVVGRTYETVPRIRMRYTSFYTFPINLNKCPSTSSSVEFVRMFRATS
jgi:hypothetical protein